MFHRFVWFAALLGVGCATIALAESPQQSPQELLRSFSQTWREANWQQKGRSSPNGYMSSKDDESWQTRMRVMQGLVRHGRASVPVLLETLKTGDPPQKILAAQTLGYLGAEVPTEPLVAALKADTDATVRLYLVDTLGMLGKAEAVDWAELLKSERNLDVRRHVTYVAERKNNSLDPRVVESLKTWDVSQINSATVGQPAPDFVLPSAQEDAIRLSDFRGKKAVVLVFIYNEILAELGKLKLN